MTSSPVKSIGAKRSGSSSLACPASSGTRLHVGVLGISISGGTGVACCTGVSGGASGGLLVSLPAQAQADKSITIIVAVVTKSFPFFILIDSSQLSK